MILFNPSIKTVKLVLATRHAEYLFVLTVVKFCIDTNLLVA